MQLPVSRGNCSLSYQKHRQIPHQLQWATFHFVSHQSEEIKGTFKLWSSNSNKHDAMAVAWGIHMPADVQCCFSVTACRNSFSHDTVWHSSSRFPSHRHYTHDRSFTHTIQLRGLALKYISISEFLLAYPKGTRATLITSNHMHLDAALPLITHNMPSLHPSPFFTHTHTHTQTHLASLWSSSTPCCEAGAMIRFSLPHACWHTCMHTDTHANKYMHTHTHACLQRQSREAEVTGLWFYAILSKCSANCHSPTVREQRGSNMGSIWTLRWSHLLPTRGSWEEKTTKYSSVG